MQRNRSLLHAAAPVHRRGGARQHLARGPVTLGEHHHLLPQNLRIEDKLPSKRTPRDTDAREYHTDLVRQQKVFWQLPRAVPQPTEAAQRAMDFEHERKMIWAAFDVPEKLPLLLRDRLVAGHADAFSERWLDAALHWTKEGRYWRCIGIERPFYDDFVLRAHAWRASGADVGKMQLSAANTDAIIDLERAVQRTDAGLPADYVWDKWGPWGNVDGTRAQQLPRFRLNPYQDPDGVNVTADDVAEYQTHDQLKERYGSIVFPDTDAYAGAFLASSNGFINFHDFDEVLRQRVAELRGVPEDQCSELCSVDDIRCMVYLAALPERFAEVLESAAAWDAVVEVVAPLRSECDLKVEAARLLHLARSVEELQTLHEEKCGFHDYHMTPDKELTGALLAHITDLKTISEQPWGPPLMRSLIDRERQVAMGEEAFAVWRELVDMDRDHRRRAWTARFSGSAHEEKTLDYMLQNFVQRTDRPGHSNEPGEDFDREQEPIGRNVQRRILESDKAASTSSWQEAADKRRQGHGKAVRESRYVDLLDDTGRNQMAHSTFK